MAYRTNGIRPQWVMYSLGVVPSCQINAYNEGVFVLDNDEVWVAVTRRRVAASGYETSDIMLGLVGPDGILWSTVDDFGFDDQYLGTGGTISHADFIPGPAYLFGNSYEHHLSTDGKYIYIYKTSYGIGGGNTDGTRLVRFDPSDGSLTWLAGRAGTWDFSYETAYRGKDAKLPRAVHTLHNDRESIYIVTLPNNQTDPGLQILKISLTDPYSVTEVAGPKFIPSSYSSPSYQWDFQTNQSTGLPNLYNSDYLPNLFYSYSYNVFGSLASDDEYLYYLGAGCLRRISKQGGSIETIMWGLPRGPVSEDSGPPYGRDDFTDHSETPYGDPVYGRASLGDRSPDLEGMLPRGRAFLYNDRLYWFNTASSSFTGFSWYGNYFAYFDMPTVLKLYSEKGPFRLDRKNPPYKAIAFNTHYDDQYSYYTWRLNTRKVKRGWRIGGDGLATGILQNFDMNPKSPLWSGKLVFQHQEYLASVIDQANSGLGSMVISWLQPTELNSQFELNIRFTGTQLKGYSAAHGLKCEIPKEITLG